LNFIPDGKIVCVACPKGYKGDGVSCKPVRKNVTDLCSPRKNPCYPGSTCDIVNGIVACGPCPLGTTGIICICSVTNSSDSKKFKLKEMEKSANLK